jgi:chromatin segregation and condensation protein Rec8/ScpA/Scc1 (kleisin family)
MLEQAGIVIVHDDIVHLAEDWLERVEDQRELGKEVEADELATRRHKLKSRAFHSRHRRPADGAPTEDEMRARREGYAERRRHAIEEAIARLFAERPEYRTRRPGQVTCALVRYLDPDFPRGSEGYPKDAEVEAILNGAAA